MPFTTGLLTNVDSVGSAVSNVVVNARNNANIEALVIVEVFIVPATTGVLTLAYLTGYIVDAKSSDIRSFFIAGNLAYEVQTSVIGPLTEVVMTTFGLDEFGKIVDGHRVLQEEMTEISLLATPPGA
ncbi:hypothetical protein SAMN02799624_00701 [Paenibacillus sp. UNC496MF]|uniref:hypothetical protein n=1 Tax=Paenibacillus sp. UNC496MF TaxID=1502753 RepID=UPI0008EA5E80|nr:hypothetical protein [Paenibacillus sp. UNC496MF]SFI37974.1 hypothetical protein SAMN02799624_00701 [Paenibacillus sp. UNC496MF]